MQPDKKKNQGQGEENFGNEVFKPGQQGTQSNQERYVYQGLHGEYPDEEDSDPANQENGVGRFGDINNEDPYDNLEDDDPAGSTPGGEGLYDLDQRQYELEAPPAHPGDVSRQGSDRNRYRTRVGSDQEGYQKEPE
jgi:hypothetical protein